MPSVLPPFKGKRIVIDPNDHRPPHVHIVGAGEHARFELFCDLGQVRLISQVGFTRALLAALAGYLVQDLSRLCGEWGRIHGQ
jgi:hypothetical protein